LSYLVGLLSPLERKNGWQLAEAAGASRPDSIQRLLNTAKWKADEVRDELWQYIVEHLGSTQAIVVLDETGFIKKGTKSVGVKRQYSGTAGRIENCQIGVFATYASSKGHTFIDRELYLPREWLDEPDRLQAAQVPPDTEFATKPELARRMLARLGAAQVPFGWVSGDEVYGGDRKLRVWLEEQHQPYVMAVACNEAVWHDQGNGPQQIQARLIAQRFEPEQWQRLSCGEGTKGWRLYDWASLKLQRFRAGEWGHWLLVRRSIAKPEELAFYLAYAPTQTELAELVAVVGQRWRVEENFEAAKGEVGLDHYEVQHWQGWYRHITLAMVAHAYLTVTQWSAQLTTQSEAERDQKKGS
jgi:SRSO17 transposase